jgi:hypothetical protein
VTVGRPGFVLSINSAVNQYARLSRSFALTNASILFSSTIRLFSPITSAASSSHYLPTYLFSIHPGHGVAFDSVEQGQTPQLCCLILQSATTHTKTSTKLRICSVTNLASHTVLCSSDLAQLSIPRRHSILLRTYSFHVCDVAQSSHELHSSQWPRSMFWHSQTIGQEAMACRFFSVCQVRRLIAPCVTD